jgi:hypothetical protein
MKISELVEQTIAPVPPGQGAPSGPTQPTIGGTNTNQSAAPNPQDTSKIKSNLDNLKTLLSKAGGGNIDTAALTQALQGDPNKPMNPRLQQALKGMLPGLADAMQNNQSANQIQSALKTGLATQQQQMGQAPK